MNLFVVGWRPGGGLEPDVAGAALTGLLRRLGFLDPARMETWAAPSGRAVLACVAHPPEQVGGARYAALGDTTAALFAGRPFRWTGPEVADGRGPLDPGFYLEPAAAWAAALDGRAAAVRYDDDDGVLEVYADPMGAYPVFATELEGARWVSNSPVALSRLHARTVEPRPETLAGLLGGGWPLAGHPLDPRVERLPRGAVHRFRPAAAAERDELLPARRIAALAGAGFDPEGAARLLVASLRALADWPGRPSVVPVTGGRDSRLILAAALRAGIAFEATTGGPPGHPDVEVARRLCEVAGVPHVPLAGDPHGDMWASPRRAAEIVRLVSGGTACVADAAGFPLGPREGPLVLWHSGQGGEIARGYYGSGAGLDREALAERLYRSFSGRRPGRTEPLSECGAALVRAEIAAFVDEQLAAGAAPADVPDLFYALRRMGTWAGPTHACVELVKDTTSPLWSARLLPHLLGAPAGERARELFHLRVLEVLAPELVEVPFADGRPWPGRQARAVRRAARTRGLARKAGAEAVRRVRGSLRRRRPPLVAGRAVPEGAPRRPADPFAAVHADVARAARAQTEHPAWAVLDRPRVERLLGRDPASLDVMSRYYVWRLGQVLWEGDDDQAPE